MVKKFFFTFSYTICLILTFFAAGNTAGAEVVCNVTDSTYGAVPNDNIDDSAAIQSALNLARNQKSTVKVIIPSGTYNISKGLRIYSNTYMQLSPDTIMIREKSAFDNNILHAVGDTGELYSYGGYDMCKNITIDGGIWDGGNVENSDNATDCLRFDHGKNITVKNATIKNVYDCHLLEFVGIKDGLIQNCKFSDFYYNKKHKNQREFGREAIQLESAWTDNPSNKSDTASCWASGSVVDGTHCENITVTGCTFTNHPICVGQHHWSASSGCKNSKNIIISNNTINADSKFTYFKTAIPCGGMDNVTIKNNIVMGPYQYGTNLYHGKNISVTGNTFSGMTKTAINSYDNAVITTIENNKISSTGDHGISLTNSTIGLKSKNSTGIVKNTITNVKSNGICLTGKTTCQRISSNTISKSGKHGISSLGKVTIGSKGKKTSGIQKNKITNNPQNAICINGGNISYISRNTLKKNKNNGISSKKGNIYSITGNTIKKSRIGIFINRKKQIKKSVKNNKIKGCTHKIVIK